RSTVVVDGAARGEDVRVLVAGVGLGGPEDRDLLRLDVAGPYRVLVAVVEDGDDVVLLDQGLGVGEGGGRVVPVVLDDDLHLVPVNPALGIHRRGPRIDDIGGLGDRRGLGAGATAQIADDQRSLARRRARRLAHGTRDQRQARRQSHRTKNATPQQTVAHGSNSHLYDPPYSIQPVTTLVRWSFSRVTRYTSGPTI